MSVKTIAELAQVVRSKQAGPYRLTLDIVFDELRVYERVRCSGVITKELIAELYSVPVETITELVEFEPGRAIKITMRRPVTSGDPGDTDVYGSCQAEPLMDIPIPWDDEVSS